MKRKGPSSSCLMTCLYRCKPGSELEIGFIELSLGSEEQGSFVEGEEVKLVARRKWTEVYFKG